MQCLRVESMKGCLSQEEWWLVASNGDEMRREEDPLLLHCNCHTHTHTHVYSLLLTHSLF